MRTDILTVFCSTLVAASADAQGGHWGTQPAPGSQHEPKLVASISAAYTTESAFLAAPGVIGHTVTTINFDTLPDGSTLPAGTSLGDQYSPVDFGCTGHTYAADVPGNCNGTYHSSPNVLFNEPNSPPLDPSPIVIHFMAPVSAVGVWNTSQLDAVRVKFYGSCNEVIADETMPNGSCELNFLGVVSVVPIYRVEAFDASPFNTGFDSFFLDDLSYVLAGETDNFEPFCFGTNCNCPCAGPTDTVGGSHLPISNGAIGGGCDNSQHTGGARLCGWGNPIPGNNDTVVIDAEGGLPGEVVILYQSNAQGAPSLFGDGVMCVTGSILRVTTHTFDSQGNAAWGFGHETLISVESAMNGDPISPGSTRYYQAFYIDPSSNFCTLGLENTSNAISINWN
jgi:hypothetical protein